MSKAFTKDDDERIEVLPERPVSPHPNLVTAEGRDAIEAEILRLQETYASALSERDDTRAAQAMRDLRYWQNRRASAQLVEDIPSGEAKFGSRVALLRDDGVETTYRIVGLDEADPKKGSVSYVSPLAQAMMGKGAGDVFRTGTHAFTIVCVS